VLASFPFTPVEFACPVAQGVASCVLANEELIFNEPFFALTIENASNELSFVAHDAR
jgi:hypothetical protein